MGNSGGVSGDVSGGIRGGVKIHVLDLYQRLYIIKS